MNSFQKFSLFVLVGLLIFQSLGAIGGGLALVISPSGALLQMPLSLLEHSPFPNFLIPGLFLLCILGLLPGYTAYALIKRPDCRFFEYLNLDKEYHWSWSLAFAIGIILILWIDFQVLFIRSIHLFHFIYSLLGTMIVFVTVLPATRQHLRIRNKQGD